METVLGLAVTATRVQTVLIEGRDATGATLEQDDFAVFTSDVSVGDACERVAEEVLSIAAADGHQLRTVAVTWTENADLEAALVLDALAASGIEATAPVIAVGARHAADALAHSVGAAVGYRRTAVCVVEPDSVVLSLIDTATGDVATPSTRSIRSVDALADWLTSVFSGEDWHPEGVFLVGSIGGLPALAERLSAELGVPVFDPPGAELALAHGAALAAGTDPVFRPGAVAKLPPLTSTRPAAGRTAALPLTMMTAGAAAIVVSTSLLVSSALLPDRPALAAREVVQFAGTAPPPAANPAPPAAVPVNTPPEPAEAVAPEPPVVDVPVYAPTPEAQFVADVAPEAPAPVIAPVEPPVSVPAPAPVVLPPPPVVAPQVPPVPDVQPRLRDRIRDRIGSGLTRIGLGN